MYTIGIVCFFVYTLMKLISWYYMINVTCDYVYSCLSILFKKSPEETLAPSVVPLTRPPIIKDIKDLTKEYTVPVPDRKYYGSETNGERFSRKDEPLNVSVRKSSTGSGSSGTESQQKVRFQEDSKRIESLERDSVDGVVDLEQRPELTQGQSSQSVDTLTQTRTKGHQDDLQQQMTPILTVEPPTPTSPKEALKEPILPKVEKHLTTEEKTVTFDTFVTRESVPNLEPLDLDLDPIPSESVDTTSVTHFFDTTIEILDEDLPPLKTPEVSQDIRNYCAKITSQIIKDATAEVTTSSTTSTVPLITLKPGFDLKLTPTDPPVLKIDQSNNSNPVLLDKADVSGQSEGQRSDRGQSEGSDRPVVTLVEDEVRKNSEPILSVPRHSFSNSNSNNDLQITPVDPEGNDPGQDDLEMGGYVTLLDEGTGGKPRNKGFLNKIRSGVEFTSMDDLEAEVGSIDSTDSATSVVTVKEIELDLDPESESIPEALATNTNIDTNQVNVGICDGNVNVVETPKSETEVSVPQPSPISNQSFPQDIKAESKSETSPSNQVEQPKEQDQAKEVKPEVVLDSVQDKPKSTPIAEKAEDVSLSPEQGKPPPQIPETAKESVKEDSEEAKVQVASLPATESTGESRTEPTPTKTPQSVQPEVKADTAPQGQSSQPLHGQSTFTIKFDLDPASTEERGSALDLDFEPFDPSLEESFELEFIPSAPSHSVPPVTLEPCRASMMMSVEALIQEPERVDLDLDTDRQTQPQQSVNDLSKEVKGHLESVSPLAGESDLVQDVLLTKPMPQTPPSTPVASVSEVKDKEVTEVKGHAVERKTESGHRDRDAIVTAVKGILDALAEHTDTESPQIPEKPEIPNSKVDKIPESQAPITQSETKSQSQQKQEDEGKRKSEEKEVKKSPQAQRKSEEAKVPLKDTSGGEEEEEEEEVIQRPPTPPKNISKKSKHCKTSQSLSSLITYAHDLSTLILQSSATAAIALAKAQGSSKGNRETLSVLGIEETAEMESGEKWDDRTPTPTFRMATPPVPHRAPSPPEDIPSIFLEGPLPSAGQQLMVSDAQVEVEGDYDYEGDDYEHMTAPIVLSGKVTLSVISGGGHDEVTDASSLSYDDRAKADGRMAIKAEKSRSRKTPSSPKEEDYKVIKKAEAESGQKGEDTAGDISVMDDHEELPRDEE